jgi:hypothetical protein
MPRFPLDSFSSYHLRSALSNPCCVFPSASFVTNANLMHCSAPKSHCGEIEGTIIDIANRSEFAVKEATKPSSAGGRATDKIIDLSVREPTDEKVNGVGIARRSDVGEASGNANRTTN